MKPIEAGCQAIIIHAYNHPEFVGREVTVIRQVQPGERVPEISKFKYDSKATTPGWLIAGDVHSNHPLHRTPGFAMAITEQLMRIDGGNPETIMDEDLILAD